MNNLITQIVGSGIGTFFAFLFGLVTYYMTKKRERWVKHKNALVELEYLLNEHLNDIKTNEDICKSSIEIMERKGGFTFNQLKILIIIPEIELKFADINLINNYFSYKINIQRINHDFLILNKANDLLHQSILSGQVSYSDIDTNKQHLVKQTRDIENYLEILDQKCKRLLAIVRLRMKKEKNYRSYLFNKYRNLLRFPSDSEIKKELKILAKEIKNKF